MSNEYIDPEILKAIERFPIGRRKIVAKAMNVEYCLPNVSSQIEGKGFVSMYKRTNSKQDQLMITLPEIMEMGGRITPAIHIDPIFARFYIKELTRICDTEGL